MTSALKIILLHGLSMIRHYITIKQISEANLIVEYYNIFKRKERKNMMSPEESTVIPSSTSEHSDVESPEVHISGHPSDVFRFRALPKVKKFIVITFSLVNLCVGVFYSALGPFFPNEVSCII